MTIHMNTQNTITPAHKMTDEQRARIKKILAHTRRPFGVMLSDQTALKILSIGAPPFSMRVRGIVNGGL